MQLFTCQKALFPLSMPLYASIQPEIQDSDDFLEHARPTLLQCSPGREPRPELLQNALTITTELLLHELATAVMLPEQLSASREFEVVASRPAEATS